MLRAAGAFCTSLSRRYIPNPFIFAIILSAVVYLLGLLLTPSGPVEMVLHWGDGFWELLTFSMQMVAILLFGYVLASSPPARRVVRWAASLPRTPGQAILLVTVLAIVFGLLSWGLGLIIGAIAAREVSLQARRRGIRVHYPLAAAAGFSGLLIFNSGFSASAPLVVNTADHFLQEQVGLIPISQTILTPANLVVAVLFLVTIPLVYRAMHPAEADVEEVPDALEEEAARLREAESVTVGGTRHQGAAVDGGAGQGAPAAGPAAAATGDDEEPSTPAVRLENSPVLTAIAVLAGLVYVGHHFATAGFDLNLNIVNLTLLVLGLIAYRTPMAYVHAVDDGIRSCGQIVLQFPFYAGIMGMMAGSGLVKVFAGWLVAVSNEHTFPLMAMLSSAVTNLFVPSAGGQWAVQGPLLIEAAQELGVDLGLTVMAFSYGDQLTNGIQPMWMLPLLGVTALKARAVLGYTAVAMIFAFGIFALGVTLLPLVLS
ncbi:short-chain fatty acid transporter [Ornithinicoccus halotolerans]|uniref:short-chain fatty acid transporter n=1 Tax=Ornithinicoccus halotolerans TaxID=1748220 RepID=UPI0012979E0A|nr:TIGR00366 family protein [Ornithinicoccus halotolerans]